LAAACQVVFKVNVRLRKLSVDDQLNVHFLATEYKEGVVKLASVDGHLLSGDCYIFTFKAGVVQLMKCRKQVTWAGISVSDRGSFI
jgi:hypothetical protein